jgi:hypothetical protein
MERLLAIIINRQSAMDEEDMDEEDVINDDVINDYGENPWYGSERKVRDVTW